MTLILTKLVRLPFRLYPLERFLSFLEYRLGHTSPDIHDSFERLRRALAIDTRSEQTRPRFTALPQEGLKLHLGCGHDVREGQVNIDVDLNFDIPHDHPDFFYWNMMKGLPLANESCVSIYSSHFFEHLFIDDAVALLRECHRVLARGGVLRLALPNQEEMCVRYLRRDRSHWPMLNLAVMFPDAADPFDPQQVPYGNFMNTAIFQPNRLYRENEHKIWWDTENTTHELQKIGFTDAHVSDFQKGVDLPDAPGEPRRFGSFYIEAIK